MRDIMALTTIDLSDIDATKWIERAQRIVRSDTGFEVQQGQIIGSQDGSNKTFYLPLSPVGDSDWDLEVTTADVQVWGYTDEFARTSLAVSSLNPATGAIMLTTAPITSQYTSIVADYVHSWMYEDSESIKLATAMFASYLYLISEFAFAPIQQKFGSLNLVYRGVRTGERGMGILGFPYERMMIEYRRIIAQFRTKLMTTIDRLAPFYTPVEYRGEVNT